MEVETTQQLYKIIDKTLNFITDKNRKDIVNKTAARVFQALRIEVNQEFEVLYDFVEKLPLVLKPGGKGKMSCESKTVFLGFSVSDVFCISGRFTADFLIQSKKG